MAQLKRARPAFSPPQPQKKTASKTSKTGSKDTGATSKRGRPSKATATKRSRAALLPSSADQSGQDASSNDDQQDDDAQLSRSPSADASPEPDFILAEVSHEITKQEPAITLPLIHRIMQEHWNGKEKTKMSTDAREVVGKYVEVFVREAIMRSSYENNARKAGGDDGWLEVEDLERVAPQLCLDF